MITKVNPDQVFEPFEPAGVTWTDSVSSGGWSGQIGPNTAQQVFQTAQEQTDIFANDAIQGVVTVPNTATQWEGAGCFGGVVNLSTTTNAVAGRFYCYAGGNGVDDANRIKCWGVNSLLKDGSLSVNYGFVFLINEWDFNVNNALTKVIAHSIGGASSVQPAEALGYTCNNLGGAGTSGIRWDYAFGSLDGAANIGIQLGTLGGNNVSSQPIFMYSRSSGGTAYLHQLQGDASSNFQITTPGNIQLNTGGLVNVANVTANGIALSANKYISFGVSASGGTSATLGASCPGATATPYVWLKAQAPDGQIVYIPAWK